MGKKQKQDEQEKSIEDKKSRTIYVSGLPYTTNEKEIEQFFQKCGEIEEVKVSKFQDSGKCRGCCHVTFKDLDAYKKSFELNKATYGNRYIEVFESKGEKVIEQKKPSDIPEGCVTIFIKNLPYDIKEDQVGDIFSKYGEIENIRFSYHPFNKHFKGFGYIDFKSSDSVKGAIKMNGKQINGRTITVDFEQGKPKLGYRLNQSLEGNQKYNKQVKEILNKKIKKDKKMVKNKESILNMSKKAKSRTDE